MATYQSISNAVSETYSGGSIPYGGTCSGSYTYGGGNAGSVPTAVTVTYTPIITTQSIENPYKGSRRNWEMIKKSGQISMTSYSRSKRTVEQFVIERPYRFRTWPWSSAWCGTICGGKVELGPKDRYWTQRDHIGSLSGINSEDGTGPTYAKVADEVTDAIASTQQEAYANALSTYDLLTELAEGKETLSHLLGKVSGASEALRKFASTDEETYRRARGLTSKQMLKSSDKALRRLGSRWMEYRYAIMPLVYSIKDVNELLAKRDTIYKTGRSRQVVHHEFTRNEALPAPWGVFTYSKCNLDATISSTVKLGYDRGALQRVLSQTAFNPFKTAWELIPYSFVVDWFLNVGDIISSQTSINLASQTACCTSVKKRETKEIWLYDKSSDTSIASRSANPCGGAQSFNYVHTRNVEQVLQRTTVESYNRFLWSKPSPKLVFDPYLNWKRFIDGLVLAYQPTKKLLRSL